MHHVRGVCCIVFDIDGMLFEFFMNFLNIEKKKIVFNISRFLRVSCYFKSGGGGGGVFYLFFIRKTILYHFTFYGIFNIKKILKSAPSLTG